METIKISRLEKCVVVIAYPDEAEITLELARSISNRIIRKFGSEKIALVHLAGLNTTVAQGVREYLSEKSAAPNKIAEAFVVKNLNQRILGNFYLRVGRPACPTEVFTSEEDAVKWVKMYCRANLKNAGADRGLPGNFGLD